MAQHDYPFRALLAKSARRSKVTKKGWVCVNSLDAECLDGWGPRWKAVYTMTALHGPVSVDDRQWHSMTTHSKHRFSNHHDDPKWPRKVKCVRIAWMQSVWMAEGLDGRPCTPWPHCMVPTSLTPDIRLHQRDLGRQWHSMTTRSERCWSNWYNDPKWPSKVECVWIAWMQSIWMAGGLDWRPSIRWWLLLLL